MTKWYCLDNDGEIRYIGEYETFDDADDATDNTAIWIITEDVALQWLAQQLKELLEN